MKKMITLEVIRPTSSPLVATRTWFRPEEAWDLDPLEAAMKKMITSNIFPPIPDRRYDWCAFWDGEEESGHYGYGITEAAAIEDLKRLDQERWEADCGETQAEDK